jgi:SRSO17 transposase
MDAISLNFAEMAKRQGLEQSMNLLIDESAFSKKGKHSAGVARQYNGNRGKIDNCQVGVFGALSAGGLTSIVQAKLYDPKSGRSKIDLARDIILHQVKDLAVKVQYVCMDAFYGRDSSLLATLKEAGIHFIADVPENLCVCFEPFQLRLPKNEGRGRKPTKRAPNKPFIKIEAYAKSLKKSDYQTLSFRYGSGKKIRANFHCKTVYIKHPEKGTRMELTLLIRKDPDGKIKFSLCHLRPNETLKGMAYHQSSRYFIENAFRNNKQHLKMNQYQTRSAQAWEKHMALCMLAMLFVTQEQTTLFETEGIYLTFYDITSIILSVILFADQRIKQNIISILLKANKYKHLARNKIYIQT